MNNKRVAIGLMQMCMSQRLRRRRVAAGSGFIAHACNCSQVSCPRAGACYWHCRGLMRFEQ